MTIGPCVVSLAEPSSGSAAAPSPPSLPQNFSYWVTFEPPTLPPSFLLQTSLARPQIHSHIHILMGITSSCPRPKSNPTVAAGTVSPVEGSKRYSVGSAATCVDDYGAKFRFPLRKEPTIRFIATTFRAAKHHNTRIIFWVDSNQTQENADLTLHLQARGITIERHYTTASALTSLRANKSYQVKQSLSL